MNTYGKSARYFQLVTRLDLVSYRAHPARASERVGSGDETNDGSCTRTQRPTHCLQQKWIIRTPSFVAPKIFAKSSHPLLPNRSRGKEFPSHASKSTIFSRSRHPSISVLSLLRYSVTPNKQNAVGIICLEMSSQDSSEKENRAPCVMIPTSRSSVTNISNARWRS